MRLLDVTLRRAPGTVALVGTVRRGDGEFELFFRYPEWCEEFLRPNADPFLAAMSIPAAEVGEELASDLPASPSLLQGLVKAAEVLHTWNPSRLGNLRFDVPLRTEPLPRGPDFAASFFSCGVDSFDTVLQNLWHPAPGNPPLRYSVFVHGLETQLDREVGAAEAAEHSVRAAAALGLTGIVGWTNIRTHFPINYGGLYCGVALGATALSLAGGCSVFLLPSSQSVASFQPWGHHALIDEACGTEYLRVENDGGNVVRTAKVVRSIARSEVALAHLRSCTINKGAAANCGACRKCLLTMVSLEIAGVLRSSDTFPRILPPDVFATTRSSRPDRLCGNLAVARKVGTSPRLIPLMQRMARRIAITGALRQYLEVSPVRGLLGRWRARKKARRALRRSRT